MKSGTTNKNKIFEQIEEISEAVNQYFEENKTKKYDRSEYSKILDMEKKLGRIALNIREEVNKSFSLADKKTTPIKSNVIDFSLNKFLADEFKIEKNGSVIKIEIPPLLHKKVYKRTQISEKYYEDYYTNEFVDSELYSFLRDYKLANGVPKYKEKVLIFVKNIVSTKRRRNDIPDTDNHEYHDLINTVSTVFLEDDSPEHAAFMFDTEYGTNDKTEIYIIPYRDPDEVMRIALNVPVSESLAENQKNNIINNDEKIIEFKPAA